MRSHHHTHEETRELYESRFDDLDAPAGMAGTLVAFALMVLLGGVMTAIVGTAIGFDISNDNIGWGALFGGLAVVFLSYMGGGWVASRMSRLAQTKNALMCVFWTAAIIVFFAVLGAIAGDKYDVIDFQNVPNWANDDDVTISAIIGAAVIIGLMFLGSLAGGLVGNRYNRHMDEELLEADDEVAADDVRVVEPVEAVQTVPANDGVPVAEPVYEEGPVRVEYTNDDATHVVGADTDLQD